MSASVRSIDYFTTTVHDSSEAAYRLLGQLATSGINLLAFNAIPVGLQATQLVLFPDNAELLAEIAREHRFDLAGPERALLIQGDDELGTLSRLHERLAAAMGRSPGNPLVIVSQKSLTGHSKGGAAAFQMLGLCQILRDGVIPPNRSLDCVDDELSNAQHFVWVRETLKFGDRLPIKAGLVTSLGFGHVSGLIALVHPQALVAALDPAEREDYLRRAGERVLAGQHRLASAIAGGRALYEKPADRRFNHDAPEKRQEADMLLDADARLGEDGWYARS